MQRPESYLLIRKNCPIDRVKIHKGLGLVCETMFMQEKENPLSVLVETRITSHELLSKYKSSISTMYS